MAVKHPVDGSLGYERDRMTDSWDLPGGTKGSLALRATGEVEVTCAGIRK
jgi:hypothetical protein